MVQQQFRQLYKVSSIVAISLDLSFDLSSLRQLTPSLDLI